MDSKQAPPKQNLELDPELLGHDPELASTVESLKRPRPTSADQRGSLDDEPPMPSSDRGPVSSRGLDSPNPPDARALVGLPSGFIIRALPIYGALGGRLRIGLLGGVLIATLGASAVAWGMVYLLEPSAFTKAPAAEPRVVSRPDLERGRVSPVFSSIEDDRAAPAATAMSAVAPSASPVSSAALERLAQHRVVAQVRSLPKPTGEAATKVVGNKPDTSAVASHDRLPMAAPAPERKAWFE